MLVLTRQINETIIIGDDIEITVVDVKGEKVRIGIRAPRNVSVHRKEVYLKILEQNVEAARSRPESLDQGKDLLSRIASLHKKPEGPGA